MSNIDEAQSNSPDVTLITVNSEQSPQRIGPLVLKLAKGERHGIAVQDLSSLAQTVAEYLVTDGYLKKTVKKGVETLTAR